MSGGEVESVQVAVAPLQGLAPRLFVTRFAAPIGDAASPDWLLALLSATAEAPVRSDDGVRAAVRDALRHGGYKPTGRGKPASEYLVRAAQEGGLRSINLAVDVCNAVSLHSGLPISVVDLDKVAPPLRVALGEKSDSYVFNASGQTIELFGLPCLFDAEGPCANAVKDAQRTKTSPQTRTTLSVVWGAAALGLQLSAALRFYTELLARAGAETVAVSVTGSST